MGTAAFESILPSIVPFPVPRRLRTLLSRVLGIDEIIRIYDHLGTRKEPGSIADRLLNFLEISFLISAADLKHIPESGAAVVAVNHPFGILDGAILASLLTKIRPDVRFLANEILTALPELRELVISVDPISGRSAVGKNGRGLRQSIEHLRNGGMLVIFPAGEVAHFRWCAGAVTDAEWNPAVARLVSIAGAPVVPMYIAGANGPTFQIAGMAHPALRTALLGRELLNKRGRRVEVHVGTPISAQKLLAMPTAREQVDYLRWRTHLLATRGQFKPHTAVPLSGRNRQANDEPIAAAMPAADVAAEIASLPTSCLLARSGDLEVYLSRAIHIPNVLHELGRLREITFRAAGEGTGKRLDLDQFDRHYLHLFVWNARPKELVGAYRLAPTDVVRRRYGIRGLYTATLFRFGDPFLDRLGPALELGRSFIREEYQRGFAPLLLLWKGIGAFVARNPRHKILFGPVSISNRYQAVSRELMISFLEKYALLRDWSGLVRNRHALRQRFLKGANRPALPNSGLGIDDLSELVSDIEQKQSGVPVLLRQYLKLGGKLLGFNVDPKFADSLDGLILVDLTKTDPKLLERYLGKKEARQFLDFRK
ncbi:MAG TPA: GNAT family N-acyltransferase [Candidatus Solibacter sp.]|nr:GNAT family N-acyltransferase [Candidatus Solibacter sp.]